MGPPGGIIIPGLGNGISNPETSDVIIPGRPYCISNPEPSCAHGSAEPRRLSVHLKHSPVVPFLQVLL